MPAGKRTSVVSDWTKLKDCAVYFAGLAFSHVTELIESKKTKNKKQLPKNIAGEGGGSGEGVAKGRRLELSEAAVAGTRQE